MTVHKNYFKKDLFKIPNFVEMLYCGMTRFGSIKLGAFRQYQNTKTIFKKNIWDRIVLRNFRNFKNFN